MITHSASDPARPAAEPATDIAVPGAVPAPGFVATTAIAQPAIRRQARHWGGFLLGGTAAFVVDSTVFMVLSEAAGVPVLGARLAAISVAMVVSWLINRTITFSIRTRPSLVEFARFAGVGWVAAAVNYVVFAGLIFWGPIVLGRSLHPIAAIGVSALCAMSVTYLGMKRAVFRK